MSDLKTGNAVESVNDIRNWLTERVAFYLQRPAHELDAEVRLVAYGLDSVYGMSIVSDIEDCFDVELEPTLAWDYPSINALSGHLGELLSLQ